MNTKHLASAFAFATLLCGCSHGGKHPEVSFIAEEAVGDTCKLYAYTVHGAHTLKPLFTDDITRHRTDSAASSIWYSSEPHYWSDDDIKFYAYLPCADVTTVSSTPEKPLYIEYTTNADLDKQSDLLFAYAQSNANANTTVKLTFKHALSWLSFVWVADDPQDPSIQYKLHSLTIRAKQSGRMSFLPDSAEPSWELVTGLGDHHFEVYECPDNDAPDDEQKFMNPSDELLRHTHSLYLAPGVAVAADIEFSVWKNGELDEYRAASNLILGGHEHTAAYIEYNTHYTYTFLPSDSDTMPMDVHLQAEEWRTNSPR